MAEEIHEPTFDGATEDRWVEPDWEALADGSPDAVAGHFLLSRTGFPPDDVDDLAVPVVDEEGRLNLHALADVAVGIDDVDVDEDTEEEIVELAHELIRDNFAAWPETKAGVKERLLAWRKEQHDREQEVKQKMTTDDEDRYGDVKDQQSETGPERPEKGR